MFPYSFNNIYGYLRFSNMHMSSPSIEEKLKKTDCTLEELLEEDEIIQEMKNQNSKLLNFFDKQKVRALIDFIIKEPEVDDHKRGHKFPFISSELLNCDVNKINDFFTMTETELESSKRKESSVSNADSDLVLSSDDHLNSFYNQNKEKTLINQEGSEEEKTYDSHLNQENPKKGSLDSDEARIKNNKSINELISNENQEEKIVGSNENQEKCKNRIELLDHLLSFLDTDEELNYVLAGYFSKFMILLLNKFPHKIVGYIYLERPEILKKLIHHCDKKSISELLPKLLLVESYLTNDKQNYSSNEKSVTSNAFTNLTNVFYLKIDSITGTRKLVLNQLFKNLIINEKNTEKVANIALICSEVIENKNTLEQILADKELLDYITGVLAANTNTLENDNYESYFWVNYNYNEILNLLLNLIKFSQIENLKQPNYKIEENEDIVNSERKISNDEIDNTLLGEIILKNLENILANFLPNEQLENSVESIRGTMDGTFGTNFKPLGVRRVKIIEFVCSLLTYFKHIRSILDKILIKSNFVRYMLNYFFQHEWNNVYQLNFENFFKIFLGNVHNHEELKKYLFEDLKLLNIFMEYGVPYTDNSESEAGFSFNSNRKINHGYFAVLMEVCHKISQTVHLKQHYSTPEWDNFIQNKVNYWKKLFDRKLCVPDIPLTDELEQTNEEESKPKEKGMETEEENYRTNEEDQNPFPSKNDDQFINQNSDNWFTPKNMEQLGGDTALDDFNSFEFVEENKFPRKSSMEEILLKEKDLYNLNVDEVDEGNYTDTSYWKGFNTNIIGIEILEDILKEL